MNEALTAYVDAFEPQGSHEAGDVERVRRVIASGDPWSRALPLHVTASAVVVHPPSGRVLLRWHERQQAWLQVGGHADPGETDPFAVACREAVEECGLDDLVAFPAAGAPALVQVVVVSVPPGKGEPAHEHADLRFVLATASPEAIRAEDDGAPLRWLEMADARALTREDNLRVALDRVAATLAAVSGGGC